MSSIDCPELKDFQFVPGEISLTSSIEEYLADGIIIKDTGEEICLLETSGKYALKDISRFGYDRVKGCFGVLSMLNAIVKNNNMATINTVSSLSLPFVHARDDTIHLWSLELCHKKLYAFKEIFKATVPRSWNNVNDIISLGILIWNLKKMIITASRAIDAAKKENNDYETNKMIGITEPRDTLLEYIQSRIEKPLRGSCYGVLLPNESNDYELNFNIPKNSTK